MNQTNVYFVLTIFISLILFIISSLIYDHSQRGYLFTSRASNETVFIEQALRRIPKCNAEDHSRQRALLHILQTWSHLAKSYDIQYWITYKTLVSYIQYYDLSPDDYDIDIFIMGQHTPQLIELTKINYSSIYELEIHPQWFITEISNRSEDIDFNGQNARFINRKNNVSINIWPTYVYPTNKRLLLLTEYRKFNNWILSPIEWTFPLEPCVFSGIRVWCPVQPKKLTTSIYGHKSMYISCTNNSWKRLYH